MAREHARIFVSIWRDQDFLALEPDAQRLYLLLTSQRDVTYAGVMPLMIRRWSRCSEHTTQDDIRQALVGLEASNFVVVDDDTEELLIRSFIRNDGVAKQPNILKNALRTAQSVESAKLRVALAAELRRLGRRDADEVAEILDPDHPAGPHPDALPMPSVTASEGHANPSAKGNGGPRNTVDNPVDRNPSQNPSGNPSRGSGGWGKGKGKGSSSVRGDCRDGATTLSTSIDPLNPRCSEHAHLAIGIRGPSCGACARAVEAVRRSEADLAAERAAAAQARRDAIASCARCDEAGWVDVPGGKVAHCDHRPALAAVRG